MPETRRWKISEPDPRANDLAAELRASPLLAQVLLNRGINQREDCTRFLRPSLTSLHPPETLPGLPRAAQRIAEGISRGEKIVIYGDYDVDGITASSILHHAIRILGGTAEFYIPHRIEEGYGLNAEAIAQLCDHGAQLIVSVDCGVTAIEAARVCTQRGVDLIITDHHEWIRDSQNHPTLPECYAIVHPRLNGEYANPGQSGLELSPSPGTPGAGRGEGQSEIQDPKSEIRSGPHPSPLPEYQERGPERNSPNATTLYANPDLCGAGVAFKLAWGVGQAVLGQEKVGDQFREFLLDATALAALGTIADVVPLVGENRVLAHFGLLGLGHCRLAGVQALMQSAQLTGKKLDSYHVGFLLAPRLNACGRMGHAKQAVELLTMADQQQATTIAQELDQKNKARQKLEKQIFSEAVAQVERLKLDRPDCRGLVLAGAGWHPGVIGIVASRLVERFHKPTVMVGLNDGHGQGSGRSINGFHLTRALSACGRFLQSFGGHEMAAGLKINESEVPVFRQAFEEYAFRMLTAEQMIPQIHLEARAELRHLTLPLVEDLQRLAPFGRGNDRPLLCMEDIEVAGEPRRVGKASEHLQLYLRQGNVWMKAIAFNQGALAEQLPRGRHIDLAVEPGINEYQGARSVELVVKDIHFR